MKINCNDLIQKRRALWNKTHDIEKDKEYITSISNEIISFFSIKNKLNKNIPLDINKKKGNISHGKIIHPPSNSGTPINISIYSIFNELILNPQFIIELFMVIVNKQRMTVPFFLNDVQKSFIDQLNNDIADYRGGKRSSLKYLILKGRQLGFTSLISAYQLACTITEKNFSGMTIADNAENTYSIFEDKAKFPYSHLPEFLKPSEKFNNRMELNFNILNSKWRISTAGNKEVGRSKTINFFHGSEAGFWDNITNIMTGLGQALTKDSIIILETTANGYNEFEELWTSSEQGLNNFEPKFFEWWLDPDYSTAFEHESLKQEFLKNMDAQFTWIFERVHWLHYEKKLSLEQCYWYYGKWKDIKENIKQEYPCTAREAFIATGNCVFSIDKLLKRKEELKQAKLIQGIGNLKLVYHDKEELVEFVPDANGYLTIYEFPKPREPYVVGADVAEGKAGGDFDAAQVIDNLTLKQVAVWHGKVDVDRYATELYKLGIYYNQALLAPEKNFNPGTIINLEKMNYPKLYMRQRLDDITKKIQHEFGWVTNRVSRPIIVADLVEYVRDYLHLIVDIPTIEEMITFITTDSGRAEAMIGKHDDLVLALAIAIKASEQGEHSMKENPLHLGKLPKDYLEDYQRANPAQKRYLEIKWGLRKE